LLLAEGREDEIRLELVPRDLGEIVMRVVDAWKPAARTAGLELGVGVAGTCSVRLDAAAIERVLMNLLSNAVKFTPKGGRIDVHLDTVEGVGPPRAVLEVRDTGVGLGEELKTRLFGRFERGLPSQRGAVGGSGLGLSLVKELI